MSEWEPLASSMVKAMKHDPATGTLQLQFKNGSTFEYNGVDDGTADALRTADSAGKFVHENIRGQYPHKQVA